MSMTGSAAFVVVLTAMTRAVVAVAIAKVLVVAVIRDVIVCAFDCVHELLWGGSAGTGQDNYSCTSDTVCNFFFVWF